MKKYDLKSMVVAEKGSKTLFPVIPESLGMERSHRAILRKLLNGAAKALRISVIPKYRPILVDGSMTQDIAEGDFSDFEAVMAGLVRIAQESVRELVELESARHTKSFMSAANKAFGINLQGVIAQEELQEYIEVVSMRNAGLIKGLSEDLVKSVRLKVVNSAINGRSASQLRSELKKLLKISDNRAKLIARDQTAKFNSDLNRIRHEQAGIEKYIWRTSKDERVRSRHQKLEGKEYSYGQKTGAEEGLPPGQPIQCRCIAQAVVEF